MTALTMILILTTCNTWTGKCEEPVRDQWTIGLPDWGDRASQVAEAIEGCRVKGVKRALRMTLTKDPYRNNSISTNIQCEYEFGAGA